MLGILRASNVQNPWGWEMLGIPSGSKCWGSLGLLNVQDP